MLKNLNGIITESLSDDTKLVLVNAIFFKAGWKKPFDSNQTRKAPFYVTATENAQVDMMFASESLAFGELDHMNATVVVLPYKVSEIVVIPFCLLMQKIYASKTFCVWNFFRRANASACTSTFLSRKTVWN